MCYRSEIDPRTRHVADLGQLQPTIFCWGRNGLLQFRAEDIADRFGEMRSCISVLTFRYHKQQIRKLFAELEHHYLAGTETPAAKSWREYQEAQALKRLQPPPAPDYRKAIEYDLFGQEIPAKLNQTRRGK
jgi:hypothetical protein